METARKYDIFEVDHPDSTDVEVDGIGRQQKGMPTLPEMRIDRDWIENETKNLGKMRDENIENSNEGDGIKETHGGI